MCSNRSLSNGKVQLLRHEKRDMVKILSLGSLNVDRVYNVEEFVNAGETISAQGFEVFLGGKGFNQSIAMARAGTPVYHAGAVGPDGADLLRVLEQEKVHVDYLQQIEIPSGHAIIQVNRKGQNSIIVYAGANGAIEQSYIERTLERFEQGDLLVLQNEISNVGYAIQKAHEKGLRVAFNPSPVTRDMFEYPLELVDYLILNELEGKALTGKTDYEEILVSLRSQYPRAMLVLTVGKDGVIYRDSHQSIRHGIYNVPVVDTTAAGDTFCGYFLAGLSQGEPLKQILENASIASSIAVSRKGASASIPTKKEVTAFQKIWEEKRRASVR